MTPDEAYRDAIRRWNEAEQRIETARREQAEAHRDMLAVLPEVVRPRRRPIRRRVGRAAWMADAPL